MNALKSIVAILGCLLVPSFIVAQTHSITASYLHVDAGSDGLLNLLAKETGEPAYGDDLDKAPGISIEWRSLPTDGISFGLEYIYFNTDASVSGDASTEDAIDLINLLGTTFQGGATVLKEDYTAHSFLLNVAYDVEIGYKLNAFLAAGVGLCHINQELSLTNPGLSYSADDSDSVFAYQFKAGLRYALNESWSVQGGIRYLDYEDFDFFYREGDYGVIITGDGDVTAFEFGLSYAY